MKIIKFVYQSKTASQIGTVRITDSQEWEPILNQARLKIAEKLAVPGFRPGKVPLDILAKKLKDKSTEILNTASEIGARKAYDFILKNHQTDLKGFRFHKTQLDKISDSEFQVSFEWQKIPSIKLAEYQNLTISLPKITVTDQDIQQQIQGLQKSYAGYIAKKDQKMVKGDFVTIDYQTTVAGKTVKSADFKDLRVELGNNQLLPEFEAQLYQMTLNKTQTLALTYPDNHYNKDLAGKKVTHTITLTKLETQILPKISKLIADLKLKMDEVAFRNLIRINLEKQKVETLKPRVLKDIKTAILAKTETSISEPYLASEFTGMKQNFIKRLAVDKRNLADYLKEKQQTEAAFDQELKAMVKKNIQELLMIFEIAKLEKLDVEDKELDDYYQMLAKETKESLADVQKKYPQVILHNYLLRLKVEKFLLTKNWPAASAIQM